MPTLIQAAEQIMAQDRPTLSRIEVSGLNVCIENQRGSKKTHGDGSKTTFLHHYGYVDGVKGDDGDSLDCYVGRDVQADFGYLVQQLNIDTGEIDEKKLMLGFSDAGRAKTAYLAMYPVHMFGGITPINLHSDNVDQPEAGAYRLLQAYLKDLKIQAGGPGSGRHKSMLTILKKKKLKHTMTKEHKAFLEENDRQAKRDERLKSLGVKGLPSGSFAEGTYSNLHEELMYHGTTERNAKGIRKKGLLQRTPDAWYGKDPKGVYLSPNKESAKSFAHGKTVNDDGSINHNEKATVIKVKVPKRSILRYDHDANVRLPESKAVYVEKDLGKRHIQAGGPGSGQYVHKKWAVPKAKKGRPKKAVKPPIKHEHDLLKKKKHEARLEQDRHKQKQLREKQKAAGLSVRGKPIVSERAKKALASMNVAKKDVQDTAELAEHKVADATKGIKQPNNSPFDVTFTSKRGKNHGIEVKAVVTQKNDKITMKKAAIDRKTKYAKKNKLHTMSTVVVDYRGGKAEPDVYHKMGVGSFRIGSMQKVKGGLKGLKAMYS